MSRRTINPTEPPPAACNGHEPQDREVGLSLRDYFAAAAVNGVIMRSSGKHTAAHIADMAYQVADAMLRERAGANDAQKAGGLFQ